MDMDEVIFRGDCSALPGAVRTVRARLGERGPAIAPEPGCRSDAEARSGEGPGGVLVVSAAELTEREATRGGVPAVIQLRGDRYRLLWVGRAGSREVWRVERQGGPGMPPRLDRRALLTGCEHRGKPSLAIFVDAAWTRQIVAWRRSLPGGVALHAEELVEAGSAPAIDDAADRGAMMGDGGRSRDAAADEVVAALLRKARCRAGLSRVLPPHASVQALCRWVEAHPSPQVARALWREIGAFRVLDPCCGTGGWLLSALDALTAVAEACLESVHGWLLDRELSGARGSAPIGALRRRLAWRARLAAGGTRERLAVEMVLLQCLRGTTEAGAEADRSRLRLGARLGVRGKALHQEAAALVDVRQGRLAGMRLERDARGVRAREEHRLFRTLPGRVQVDAEALGRAELLLGRMRLEGDSPLAELEEARAEIRRRRDALAALVGSPDRSRHSGFPLDPRIEYSSILASGGFDLVHADPRSRGRADEGRRR